MENGHRELNLSKHPMCKSWNRIGTGKKVLLIDADPQGSLTISLGYEEPDEMEYSLATLIMNIVNDEKLNIHL